MKNFQNLIKNIEKRPKNCVDIVVKREIIIGWLK